jgi:hypothetical protein
MKSGQFANSDATSTGNFLLSPVSDLTVTSLVKRTVFYFDNQGGGKLSYYYLGKNYNTNLSDGSSYTGTTVSYAKFGPATTVLKQTNTDDVTFVVTRFFGTNYGIIYTEHYWPDGSYRGQDTGSFGLGSQNSGGNAPAALNSRSLQVSDAGSAFNLSFGTDAFSQISFDGNFSSGAGNYSYNVTAPNSATIDLAYIVPTDVSGRTSAANLAFYAPNLAYLINGDNTVSAAVLGNLNSLAYGSGVGKTLYFTNNYNQAVSTVQVGLDGNMNSTGGLEFSAGYALSTFTPAADMYQLNFWSGNYTGNPGWLQLNYISATNGTYKVSIFDPGNNPLYVEYGKFGQP